MARCGDCGFDNSDAANFCGGCGRRLMQTLDVVEEPPPPALDIKVDNGSLRLVTVMFVDVQASLTHVRDRDPEDIRAFLNRVLAVIQDSVVRFGGTVAQIAGDGVMALFGAPVALEDHAVRACHAALAMHESMAALDTASGSLAPRLRIGLNSGSVIVGTFGPDEAFGHSAIGATTFMAARMEQIATAGTTRLTSHTLSLAEGFVVAEPMGECVVKGIIGGVETFELIGATQRVGLTVRMRLANSSFTGRDTELEQVRRALRDPARLTALRLSGEPGVGKSRLVLQSLTGSERSTVLQAEGLSHERSPFGSLIRALKGYLGIGDQDGVTEVAGKLDGLLDRLRLRDEAVPLQALLNLALTDPDWPELDPAQRRLRMFHALR